MTACRRRGGRRTPAGPSRSRRIGSLCACLLASLLLASPLSAQPASSLASVRAAAERALLAGNVDEVRRLAETYKGDEGLIVLHARALVSRGHYAQAEALLQVPAFEAPTGDAALEAGLLQMYLGRRQEARRTLHLLLLGGPRGRGERDYLRAARAARALGRFEDANQYFREAVAQAPTDPAINTAWGELFLEKHNKQEAVRSFQVALKTAPDYGPALVGMARALADENPPAARRLAQRALELNASDLDAHTVLAGLAIDRDEKDAARATLTAALAVNPQHLESLAFTAALAYVEGNAAAHQAAVEKVLAINPLHGEVHRVVGEVTARYYRFDEAVEHVRRAIALDRDNARAYADLGAHLMRTGDERAARRSLELAFRADPYDAVTFNLLELLDTLDQFETLREGDLVVRLHPEEVGVLREYAPALAREALDALSKQWQFTPTGPILLEIFPQHDDFAVRNVGLPGMIGALGACFGRVVTLDSPRARPPGSFNWGSTLWHEMAHVITLQLSKQRVPRWLTEGISVFEETRARPEWGREMEIPFAHAIEQGAVLPLADLNAGFTNPQTISIAYYEASLLVEHLVATYGQDALRALVASFADGLDTEEALRRTLNVEMPALQASFDGFLERRFGALRAALEAPEGFSPDLPLDRLRTLGAAHPDSFPVQMALGHALKEAAPAEALAAFDRAAAAVPMATGDDSPYVHIADVALASGDTARAVAALDALTAYDHTDVASARRLAALVEKVGDTRRLRTALRRVVAVDPFDAAAHTELGRQALTAGEGPEAVRAFRVALAAGPVDRAAAHADLAESLVLTGDRPAARREALAALEIAPTYERAQDLLLTLVEGQR